MEESEEKENDIILETGLLEGRGNYQGGSKEKETIFPSLLKEKQKIVKKAKKFLNNEKDILNNLDEVTDITDEETIPPTPQKVIKRKILRTSASAPRLVFNPSPQKVTTPRRRKRV